ncbi:MAG TPA: tetratricopeptide repeat protein [Elusimicrobiales bacterium]|nr:tetratricopeptide repeat protein [Elusimicrobiales bacterium]
MKRIPPPGESSTKAASLWPLLIAAVTFAVFLPSLRNGFVNWDDTLNLVGNYQYRGLGCAQLKWMFTTCYTGPYQPLSWATLGLDYLLWGMDPFGYHLTNVLLHCFNAFLFCLLCAKLFALAARPSGPEGSTAVNISAGFAALVFAVHPLRVESVAWVTERRDVLCGLFYLLTLLCYIAARSGSGQKAPAWRRHALPAAAFFLALLSKGMAVSLPLVLVILDIYPLRRLPADPRQWFSRENRELWYEKIPYFALAAIFGAIGYACQDQTGAVASYQAFGFDRRAAQVFFALFFYVRKTFIPLELSPLYKLPEDSGLLYFPVMLAAAAAVIITALAIALRRRWPAGLAAWLCYLAIIFPVAGAVKLGVQAAADRYTYLACLGFAALAGAGLRAGLQAADTRLRKGCVLLACLVIAGLAALTWRQQGVWRNSETLWRQALAVDPDIDLARNNLGEALAAQGRIDEAIIHYRNAVSLSPAYAIAHYNLANALVPKALLDEAVSHYRAALKNNPDFPQAHYNLAAVLAAQGKTGEAVEHYRETLRLGPDADANYKLGLLLSAQGRTEAAAAHFREAARLNPSLRAPAPGRK